MAVSTFMEPPKTFTPAEFATMRFRLVTRTDNMMVSFLLPLSQKLDAEVKAAERRGENPSDSLDLEGLATHACGSWLRFLFGETVATTIACLLIQQDTPFTRSLVYQHYIALRLKTSYLCNLERLMGFPAWLVKVLLNFMPALPATDADVSYDEQASPPPAFKALQRIAIPTVVRWVQDVTFPPPAPLSFSRRAARSTVRHTLRAASNCCGAVVGHQLWGAQGALLLGEVFENIAAGQEEKVLVFLSLGLRKRVKDC